MKPSKVQRAVLAECDQAGWLWQGERNTWRWFRTLPNGMIYQAAKNPTVCVLVEHGYLARTPPGDRVTITAKGRAALSNGDR